MNMLIIWFFIIIGIAFLKSFLRKRFGIDQEERSGIPVKRFEHWSGVVMLAAIASLILFFVDAPEPFFFWVFIIFLIVNAAQVFLEWKFLKGSRQYLMSITYFAVTGLALFAFIAVVSWQIG